ncbi:putative ABC transport system permease protein [Desulfonatronum thiosulfatophilum]|uniref:Putative ABC transport system permease protein n=1 Tax=Desulfonatronum thiosulfatophilum TaxID=617002 RepID=A0A1G6C674_9BACT|nr:ABC transporter permease [Desulfonatronum thiosulfatophilum]SDB28324.1 putative ABC transport system permease protein [Desulfonatronum thiosulfatophilum]
MMLKANLREASRSLIAAKQRSILALLGIVIGIGSVIALVSTGALAQRETLRQFMEMGTDIISIQMEQGRGDRSGEPTGFSLEEALALPERLTTIRTVAPYASAFGELRREGQRVSIPLLGVTESFVDLNKLELDQGRFISDLDVLMSHAVLGGNLAQRLMGQGIAVDVGEHLYFDNRKLTVAGILHPAAMGAMRPYEASEGLMLPITTVLRISPQNAIRTVMARLEPGVTASQATAEVQAYFAGLARPKQIRVTSPEQIIEHMERQSRMFTLLLGAIGSISLVVGGVGVMNVMLVSVSERRREIGIRRALGAQKRDIQWQFLIESVLLSLVGGILGILIGVGASYGIAHYSGWQFELVHGALLLGVGVSAAVGIFFGYYPARQAAALNPIQALRAE